MAFVNNTELFFRTIPKNSYGICAFSGGKDSTMALSIAMKTGQIKELVYFTDNDFDVSCNYSNEILKKQAE